MPKTWSPRRWEGQRKRGLADFEGRFERSSGCWLWTGNRNRKGYGYMRFMGKAWLAHRLAYSLARGPIPEGLFVCHSCDVPACVNPDHLWLGTKAENNHDMGRKHRARGWSRPGAANPAAKLTQEQVDDIRARYWAGASAKAIATDYGIAYHHAWNIARGRAWRDGWIAPVKAKTPPLSPAERQRRYRASKKGQTPNATPSRSTQTGRPVE